MDDSSFGLGSYVVNLSNKIGQGAFGIVYTGKHVKTNENVAVKQCQIQSDHAGSLAMKEIKNLQQVDKHPHIVQLIDFHYTRNAIWIVMEFCDSGDLVKYMKVNNPGLNEKVKIMYQCASAVAFMHSLEYPVIHRDIKPPNILMKAIGNTHIAKITDFGISKISDELPKPDMSMMYSTAVGTPGYMAPEFFLQEIYTASVDIFALGLVYLAMLNYDPEKPDMIPLSANSRRLGMMMPIGAEMAQFGKMKMPLPELIEDVTEDTSIVTTLKELIRKMASYDRKARIPMFEVEKQLHKLCSTLGTGNEGSHAQEQHSAPDDDLSEHVLMSVKEALYQISVDSGIGNSFSMMLTEMLGKNNPMVEVPTKGNLAQAFIKVDAFDRVLQLEDKRNLLHRSFQSVIDQGQDVGSTLTDAFSQVCAEKEVDSAKKERIVEIGCRLGLFLTEGGRHIDAEKVYVSGLQFCKKMSSKYHWQKALEICTRLIIVKTENYKFSEAEEVWDMSQIFLQKLKASKQPVNNALLYAAYSLLLFAQSFSDKAYSYSDLALQEVNSTVPLADIVYILCYCSLACMGKNKLRKFELLVKYNMSFCRKHFGTGHLLFSYALICHANFLQKSDFLEEAIKDSEECLAIRKQVFAGKNLLVAILYKKLAYLECQRAHYTTQDYSKSRSYIDKSISIMEFLLPKDHASTADAKRQKGMTLESAAGYIKDERQKHECLNEALELEKLAAAVFVKVYGQQSYATLTTYQNIALTYKAMGKYKESEAMFLKAVSGLEKILTKEDLDLIITLETLAKLYSEHMKKYEEAEKIFKRCIQTRKKICPTSIFLEWNYQHLIQMFQATKNSKKEQEYNKALQEQKSLREKENKQGGVKQEEPIHVEGLKTVEDLVEQFFQLD